MGSVYKGAVLEVKNDLGTALKEIHFFFFVLVFSRILVFGNVCPAEIIPTDTEDFLSTTKKNECGNYTTAAYSNLYLFMAAH